MAYKKLFIDSDVLIDLFLKREPFWKYTELLLTACGPRGIKLSTSTLIIANISYILSKKLDRQIVKQSINTLKTIIDILPFEPEIIDLAIDSEFADFEDAIQYFIARKYQCDAIISRNLKHYKKAELPVLSTEQFLRTL